jgi:hypothetical protein
VVLYKEQGYQVTAVKIKCDVKRIIEKPIPVQNLHVQQSFKKSRFSGY